MSWLLAYYFFIIPNFQIKQEIIWTLLKKHHGLRFQLVKENKYSKTQKNLDTLFHWIYAILTFSVTWM